MFLKRVTRVKLVRSDGQRPSYLAVLVLLAGFQRTSCSYHNDNTFGRTHIDHALQTVLVKNQLNLEQIERLQNEPYSEAVASHEGVKGKMTKAEDSDQNVSVLSWYHRKLLCL